MKRILPKEAKEKVIGFKYVGSDSSLLYKYFLSPLA
tara:strand:- start:733 stop:840 length:108 start_codon:yes stop_codon:yes gene_type:complete